MKLSVSHFHQGESSFNAHIQNPGPSHGLQEALSLNNKVYSCSEWFMLACLHIDSRVYVLFMLAEHLLGSRLYFKH